MFFLPAISRTYGRQLQNQQFINNTLKEQLFADILQNLTSSDFISDIFESNKYMKIRFIFTFFYRKKVKQNKKAKWL